MPRCCVCGQGDTAFCLDCAPSVSDARISNLRSDAPETPFFTNAWIDVDANVTVHEAVTSVNTAVSVDTVLLRTSTTSGYPEHDFGSSILQGAVAPKRSAHRASIAAVTLGSYAGALREAILHFKSGRRDVGDALAAFLIARFSNSELIRHLDRPIIVPIPTTHARRRERGFDGGEFLAKAFARAAGLEYAAMLQQSAGDAQRGKSREERLAANRRFVVARRAGHTYRTRTVVLIDDVITTGSTLRDVATILESIDVCVPVVLALARTPLLAGTNDTVSEHRNEP